MKKIKTIGFILLLAVSGCTSSKITTSWKEKDITPQNYNKIMVLGLITQKDRTIQENMENHFVGDLATLGYNALSSLKEYGPKAFDKMNEEAALAKLKSSGVDAIITIVLLDKKKERRYVSSGVSNPAGPYYNNFWNYRNNVFGRIFEPGYYVTDTKYFWESNLYDMRTQKLLYSVQTQTFDPENSASMAHEYGKLIVKDMVKQHILADKHPADMEPQ